MKQINDTKYTDVLQKEKVAKIYKFAIACYKKECQVVAEEETVYVYLKKSRRNMACKNQKKSRSFILLFFFGLDAIEHT